MDDLAFGDDDEIEPEHYRLFDQIHARSLSERMKNNNTDDPSIQEAHNKSQESLLGVLPPPPPPPTSSIVPPRSPLLAMPSSPSPHLSMPKISAAEHQNISEPPFPTSTAAPGKSLTGTETYRSLSPPNSTTNRTTNSSPHPHRTMASSSSISSSSSSLAVGTKCDLAMDSSSFVDLPNSAAAAAAAASIPPPTENQRQSSFYLSLLVHADLETKEKGGTATTAAAAAATPTMPNMQSLYPADHSPPNRNGQKSSFSDSTLDHSAQQPHRRSSYLDRKPSAKKMNVHGGSGFEQERASSWNASHFADSTFDFSSSASAAAEGGEETVPNPPTSLLYPGSAAAAAAVPPTTDLGRQSSFYRSLLESAKVTTTTTTGNNTSGKKEEVIPSPPDKTTRQSSFYLSLLASAAAEEHNNPNLAPPATSQHVSSSVPHPHHSQASHSSSSTGNINDKMTDVFIEQMKKLHVSTHGGGGSLTTGSSGNGTAMDNLVDRGGSGGGEMDAVPPPVDGVNRQSSFYLSLFAPPSDTTMGGGAGAGPPGGNTGDAAMKLPPSLPTIDNKITPSRSTATPSPTMLTSTSSLTVEEIMAIAAATERADAEDVVKAAKIGSVCGEKSNGSENKNSSSIPMISGGDNSNNNNNIDVRLVGQTIDAEQYNEQIAILTKIQEERKAEQQTLLKLQNDKEEEDRRRNNLLQVGATNHQDIISSGVSGELGGGANTYPSSTVGGPSNTTTNKANASDLSSNTELLMKGNRETWEAIAAGQAHVVTCLGCRGKMQVAKSASLVFCPICRTVSPNKTSLSRNTSLNPDDDDEEAFGYMDETVSDALQRQEYLSVLRSRGADISNTVACRELDETVMDKVTRKLKKYNATKEADKTVERKLDMYSTNRRAEERVEQKLNMYRENRAADRKVEQKLHHYAEQKRKNNRDDDYEYEM